MLVLQRPCLTKACSREWWLRVAFLAVVAVALSEGAHAQPRGPVEEEFPTSLNGEHVAIIITLMSAVGLLICVVFALSAASRLWKPTLPMVVSLMIFAMLALVSVITWHTTYVGFRSVIHGQILTTIKRIGDATAALEQDMEEGYSMLSFFKQRVLFGPNSLPDPLGKYPDPSLFTWSILAAIDRNAEMTAGLHYGLTDGTLLGIIYPVSLPSHKMALLYPGHDSPIPCSARFDYSIDAGYGPCDPAACGANTTFDQLFCPLTCDLKTYRQEFCISNSTHNSHVFVEAHKIPVNHTFTVTKELLFRGLTTQYDPRKRRWYIDSVNNTALTWQPPHVYPTQLPGFTLTARLERKGVFLGVAAVDYTLDSMRKLLASLLPTEHSTICVMTSSGVILSSSLSTEALNRETGFPNIFKLYNILDAPNPESRFRAGVERVVAAHGGSIEEANLALYHSIYQMREFDACVYHRVLRVSGDMRLMVVVVVPYRDLMKKGDDASTRALAVAVGLSFFLGALTLFLTSVGLSPLRGLERVMNRVANMQLDQNGEAAMKHSMLSEIVCIQQSLAKMVEILVEFRSYLPQSLLDVSDDECVLSGTEISTTPVKETATIVFTDVYGSSQCWEESPQGMRQAMRVHHAVIRDTLREYSGYEVKTISDSFMICFPSPQQAVRFALAAQVQLNAAKWGDEILQVPFCDATADGLWAGLRVTIGIHTGECDVEQTQQTGRLDYYGTTVNKAARVQGSCIAGAVAITPEVRNQCTFNPASWGGKPPVVCEMGMISLKGLAGGSHLTLLIPGELSGRLSLVSKQVKTKIAEMEKRGIDDSRGLRDPRDRSRSRRCGGAGSSQGWTSEHSSSVHCDEVVLTKERFRECLARTNGTAVVRVQVQFGDGILVLEDPVLAVNAALGRMLHCAAKESGEVMSVTGAEALVGWNIRRVASHQMLSAARFVRSYCMRMAAAPEVNVSSGFSHGSLLTGSVGGSGQKFLNSFGPALLMTQLLVASAIDLGSKCLVAVCPSGDARCLWALSRELRPVDTWEIGTQKVVIYELMVTFDVADFDDGTPEEVPFAWSPLYSASYLARDCETIELQGSTDIRRGDKVLGKVLSMLQQGEHLREPLDESELI